ncbi:hypothetical protein HU200_055281 [Digitaria exilis]|uniref:Plant heme peroxidase family profile domain-containing protein n=1 Tax=Digitaria exilis TaxID=1010633 RepID=A0A835APC0_9POAL|nr:hypothetical protein HU200_055281 [Digitaria exilis]
MSASSEIPESEGRPTYHYCLPASLSAETCLGFICGPGGLRQFYTSPTHLAHDSIQLRWLSGFDLLPMALRLLPVVVVFVAAAASCRAALAFPATGMQLPGLPVAGLAVGFYNESCPQVEELVLAEMRAMVAKDWTIGPALLRFMFHDCLVRLQSNPTIDLRAHFVFVSCVRVPSRRAHGMMRLGCDASIMLISRNKTGERNAFPSYGLRGYDEIEQIKAKVEAACPLTVSCADIIALAARDAVFLVYTHPVVTPVASNGPRYAVETGRRDGKMSFNIDANNDLPPPSSNIVDLKTYFSVKGLGWKDLVVLSGSHTIGRAQCSTFAADRLYNFSGKLEQDPSLNKTYAAGLRELCEPGVVNDTTPVPMDPSSPYTFDLGYYRDVVGNTSLFLSDQALMDDRWTRAYVERMAAAASPEEFFADYAVAMTNMGRIEVLTGDNGEIRKTCAAQAD